MLRSKITFLEPRPRLRELRRGTPIPYTGIPEDDLRRFLALNLAARLRFVFIPKVATTDHA